MPDPAAAVGAATTLVDLLRRRARAQPDDRAYALLSDRGAEEAAITFAALEHRAIALARHIAAVAAPGDRALLLCPTGIDFLVALFGCAFAGVIAVPLRLPRRQSTRDSSAAIVADCAPRLALSLVALIDDGSGELVGRLAAPGLAWLAVDAAEEARLADLPPPPAPDDIALLQYTSGSTASPKGVMVSHANLLANLAMIQAAFGNTSQSTIVSWVPLYHDMGLVINVLQSLYVGALCVLLPPAAFMQRPLLWLRAISDFRAEVATSPNFGFDLCVERYRPEQMHGIDLSCWRLALNGAEPVRAATLRRFAATFAPHGFAAEAIYPAYGMAEATVLVAAGRRGAGPVLRRVSRAGLQGSRVLTPRDEADEQAAVGCGRALPEERIAIIDPESRRRLAPDQVGEIWIAGANVARGYWQNPAATAEAFGADIAGEGDARWLRSGDLGFLDANGELFVTGRRKEVVIIRGANHYPQDIEDTVQRAHPALRRHGGAAFAVDNEDADADAPERLVVVQEVERTQRHRIEPGEIVASIREAVVREHEVAPFDIVLLRPGALPKTTSGKIQRGLARRHWLAGTLQRL